MVHFELLKIIIIAGWDQPTLASIRVPLRGRDGIPVDLEQRGDGGAHGSADYPSLALPSLPDAIQDLVPGLPNSVVDAWVLPPEGQPGGYLLPSGALRGVVVAVLDGEGCRQTSPWTSGPAPEAAAAAWRRRRSTSYSGSPWC